MGDDGSSRVASLRGASIWTCQVRKLWSHLGRARGDVGEWCGKEVESVLPVKREVPLRQELN